MPNNFSYSQLNQFTMCQKVYEYRYIDRIPSQVNGALICGDAYHKALAHAYTSIVIYKDTPSIEEVLSIYSDTWDKRLNERVMVSEGAQIFIPSVDFKGKNPGQIKDAGIQLVKLYYTTIMPTIIPINVEIRKSVIYKGIPLIGYIDLIDWEDVVIDHKMKSRKFSNDELTKDLQSAFYGLMLGRETLNFQYHTALTTKKPDIKIVPLKKSKGDMDWVGEVIVSSWKQIQAGHFAPCSSGWWCGQKQCAYWGRCRMPSTF